MRLRREVLIRILSTVAVAIIATGVMYWAIPRSPDREVEVVIDLYAGRSMSPPRWGTDFGVANWNTRTFRRCVSTWPPSHMSALLRLAMRLDPRSQDDASRYHRLAWAASMMVDDGGSPELLDAWRQTGFLAWSVESLAHEPKHVSAMAIERLLQLFIALPGADGEGALQALMARPSHTKDNHGGSIGSVIRLLGHLRDPPSEGLIARLDSFRDDPAVTEDDWEFSAARAVDWVIDASPSACSALVRLYARTPARREYGHDLPGIPAGDAVRGTHPP